MLSVRVVSQPTLPCSSTVDTQTLALTGLPLTPIARRSNASAVAVLPAGTIYSFRNAKWDMENLACVSLRPDMLCFVYRV